MYLKRLDLYGFKSFADRTELEFVPGITAVVGPNGSGKSNIADAIRWVLGEQSAKSLRGIKMEDIIFAGSDTRKGVNFSEVSLTLDNTSHKLPMDYSEVTVTRRLYRTGESEFFINKAPCRLKDIVELFMDTGLGREAYSIIGQGKIEEILSTKAEDRRGIFEEAAGIVKYKVRKKEAERKLEETEAVLLRVSDILQEIEGQVAPLKEQSDRAKKYKDLREKLREKEVGIYLYTIEETYARWEESKAAIEELREKEQQLSAQLSKWDAEIEAKRWQVAQLDQELEKSHEDLIQTVEQVEKLDGELRLTGERRENTAGSKAALLKEEERLLRKREELLEKKEKISAEVARLQRENEELENSLSQAEARLRNLTLAGMKSLEQMKNEYIEILSQMAAARNEEKNLSHQQEQLHHKKERIGQEIEKGEKGKKEIEERIAALKQEEEEHETTIRRLQGEIHELNASFIEWKRKEEEFLPLLRRIEQSQDQLSSRLEVLKELQADYSGFHHGVKEILLARGKSLSGIHGAVLELIEVPKELETAIEIALGNALQYVVVEDEESGRKAISYLKKRQLGRATFLPLDVIKGRKLSPEEERKLLNDRGVVGIASNLIRFEARYRSVIENLLGNVILVKDLEKANEVARLFGYRYRIVTLEGDVVNPGGSMTGGSLKQKGNSLLGRERAIEETEKELELLTAKGRKIREERTNLQETIRQLQLEIDKKGSLLEQHTASLQKHKTELARLMAEYRNMESSLLYWQGEWELLLKEEEELQAKGEELSLKLSGLKAEENEKKKRIEEAEQAKRDQENSKEELSQEMTRLKVALAEKRQELLSWKENETSVTDEIRRTEEEKTRKEEERKLLEEKEEEHRFNEGILLKHLEELRLKREELQSLLEEKRKIRQEITLSLEKLESEGKELRRKVKGIQESLHQEEVKENRFEIELDNLLEKLRDEYDLTYEAAKEFFTLPPEEETYLIRQDILHLKREIAQLGDVNLGAIEEYERISERYSFLTNQSEDLKKAKETLYQVIREMEEEMTKRFEDAFTLIQGEFRRAFSELFGGGRADLLLTSPDHPLETGVEIMAQPPGKKLQNLSLLSGGERALTAIALLFAILRVRPVPFCVLDEVEAALDEANVSRFAKYLKDFSDQTQFIVITHRKGTMEEADVLYGVTMEGSGVSKMVSVKLEEVVKEGEGKAS
ncbi:Chromosome partition protein Smc [[Clostridium] ultunense Esp]|nr:Chromosome partition protein Smc [[Clostridium] ultunense Esp]